MVDWTLQEALNFTDEDLVANRAGKLGPSQQGRLATTTGRSQMNLVVGGVFVAGLLLTVAFVLPQYLPFSRSFLQYVPIVVVLLVIVGLDMFLASMRRHRRVARLDQPVLLVEGAVTRSSTAPMSGIGVLPTYRMSIGPVTFAFASPEPMRAFVNSKRYRGYYVSGAVPTLVSAEPV
jgi:hypothetical protein